MKTATKEEFAHTTVRLPVSMIRALDAIASRDCLPNRSHVLRSILQQTLTTSTVPNAESGTYHNTERPNTN